MDVAAVADDVVVAAGGGDVRGVLGCLVRADEVEHLRGPRPVGDPVEFRPDVLFARVEEVIGAVPVGEFERGVLQVDGGDPGRTHRVETLETDVAEPADPDHDRVIAGVQVAHRLLRRVIGRDPRVGVWSDVDRFDSRRQRDHRPFARVEVLREPSVRGQPVERVVLAVHRLPEPARPAGPTRLDGVTDDRVALGDEVHLRPGLDDRPRVLVAERHRERLGYVLRPHPLDDVVVSLTPSRALHLDDHVVGPVDRRSVDLVDGESLAHLVRVLVESGCLHVPTVPRPSQ